MTTRLNTDSQSAEEVPRRGFLTKAFAVVIGGIVSLFPFAAGLAVYLDPLRSRKKEGAAEEDDGFTKVAVLDDLLVGKAPRRYMVIDDRVDAWNMFPQVPIGAIYLLRQSESEVLALNAKCTHLRCPVDFDRNRDVYQCPCHNSSFKVTGEIDNEDSPAARPLDALDVEIRDNGEVWVKYQDFRGATPEKIAEV